MRDRILVTAIGTMTSTAIVRQLKQNADVYIIGANLFDRYEVVTSLDVDEYYSFPSVLADEDAYIAFVLDFCQRHDVNYYFASIDEEVVLLSTHRKAFEAIGVVLCIPNGGLIDICHYKDRFGAWILKEFPAIAIKTFTDFSEADDADFPLFVKPIEGRASIGCQSVVSREDANRLLAGGFIESAHVIQRLMTGDNVTVDMVRNAKTGRKAQLQRRELLRNGNGCGIAVEIIHDPKLAIICNELMDRLDLNGVINAEFFKGDDGFKIIEINPRFSAGTDYSCMAGLNTVLCGLSVAKDRDFEVGELFYGRHFAKRYETYQMD